MRNILPIALVILFALSAAAQNTSSKKSSFWTMGDDDETYDRPTQSKDVVPLNNIYPYINDKIVYTEVFEVPDTTINDIYIKAKLWFVDNFKDAKSVIQIDDKENGIIKGKGIWDYTGGYSFYYTLTIKIKKRKVKYELTDIIHNWSGYISPIGFQSVNEPLETWDKPSKRKSAIKESEGINKHFVDLTNSLKTSLISKPDTDW